MSKNSLALLVLSSIFCVAAQAQSLASQVLERIKETGTLTAGVRKDAIPFGYVNRQGEWVGYSIDVLHLLQQRLEQDLQQPIQLNLVEVTPRNRFELVSSHQIDIECGTTTFTWEREQWVDFTLSYFPNGTQMLVPADTGFWSIPDLANQRIGAVPDTTNEAALQTLQPRAILVRVNDRFDGFQKLQRGEIDGFVSDGITLEGLKRTAEDPDAWEVVPDLPYVLESYACMVPEDESDWKDFVNFTLTGFMQGVVNGEPERVEIYDRWFGETGIAPYSRELVTNYFFSIVNVLEWIPTVDSWAE